MHTIDNARKHKNPQVSESFVQYLILPSEPEETAAAAAGRDSSFGFRNRYLTKRRVMRTIRRLRREHTRGL